MSSIPFTPTTGQAVFPVETLHAECSRLHLEPSRPNIRRVARAFDLVARFYVQERKITFAANDDDGRIYHVPSQNGDQSYAVTVRTTRRGPAPIDTYDCTCPDSAVNQNRCKHAIAVLSIEEFEYDQELVRHAEDHADDLRDLDPEIAQLMPDDTEAFETAWNQR